MPTFGHAAVCSPLTRASETGIRVLQEGGNAIDAAIATNLLLAVAYPHMCGAGGDLFAIVWRDGELAGLNSSGRLPRSAELPVGGVPERGIAAATVPGAVAGWRALAGRYGTRSLEDLAAPAVALAREGFQPSRGLAGAIERLHDLLIRDESAASVFIERDRIVQPDLATTLEHLDDFYERIARSAPAPFRPDDLLEHRAEWVEPMRAPFAGTEVCEMPPNSRGHLVLRALERLQPLEGLTPNDAEWHRRLIAAAADAGLTGDTIHLVTVDATGMAVSLTQSLYMGFGSGVMVPGTGVLLHNRGAYFTPDTYVGGARPIHTLSPAMALSDGKPRLVFGTMGGPAQVQIHLQLLARILVAGEDPQDAIAAPRWVLGEGVLFVEDGLPDLNGSVERPVRPIPSPNNAGHAQAIEISANGLRAGSDPRADGVAVGY